MKTILRKLFRISEIVETVANVESVVSATNANAPSESMKNLIKMKEAMSLIQASAPTVRKYARLGYYKEYRFGEKLVFYNKQEMLDFILRQGSTKKL